MEINYNEIADKILPLDQKDKLFGEIYIMTCIVNNKQYVGQTLSHRKNHNKYRPHNSKGRVKDHFCEAIKNTRINGCTYLNQAIRKYTPENFKYEVLERCLIADIDELEIKYIAKYNTLSPNGYNLTSGGRAAVKWTNNKEISRNEIGINIPSKRGREFGYKHKDDTLQKMKNNHQVTNELPIVQARMKNAMTTYYDNLKIKKLSEFPLDKDVTKYIRPVYKKETGVHYNYIIRLTRDNKFTMETSGQSLETTYNRLHNVLKKAYELRIQNAQK
jgi:hypothetical protein